MKFFSTSKRFLSFVIKNFIDHGAGYQAASLTFTTLLALVPLMTVSLSLLAILPAGEQINRELQQFVFANFVPATGKVVQTYLESFTQQAKQLSLFGFVGLLVTVLVMMLTIEHALNSIWHNRRRRYPLLRLFVYWGAVSIAPLLLALIIFIVAYVSNFSDYTHGVIEFLPMFAVFLVYLFLYGFVPNCPVGLKAAVISALLATGLFELARLAFSYYISQYPTYQFIYGAFATVPIFLLWIYYVWLVTLFAAEVSRAISLGYASRTGASLDGFSHALRWLYQLQKAFDDQRSMNLKQLIKSDPYCYQVSPEKQLEALQHAGFIKPIGAANWVLTQPIIDLSIQHIRQRLPWKLPGSQQLKRYHTQSEQRLATIITTIQQQLDENLKAPLKSLFE